MKRTLAYALAATLLAACSTQEKDFQTPNQDDAVFYASFEQPTEPGTKVYATEDLYLRWNADDRITIFNKYTYNQEYRFNGETGDNSGSFKKVESGDFVTGNYLDNIYAVYPFLETTRISETSVVSVTLPAEQQYAQNTFGLGANTMISATVDNQLLFKNVGGYLVLKLYGNGVSVSSITLKGNNGEKIAGKATVSMPLDGAPSAVLAEDATSEITLACDTPVALGATAEEGTEFWFVVPPATFSKGFTITVSDAGGTFEKSTEKAISIERNKLSKMSPIQVELSQPRNVIYYTSSDGNVVTPYNPEVFGASILSNEYVDGRGAISFDREVTRIGSNAFFHCASLTDIRIPESVTSIGYSAFSGCESLTSITIPESVTSIWDSAFFRCTGLTSITIPESVTSIGDYAFYSCTGLTSITIPDSVTIIGVGSFLGCSSLTSITIPDSVTSIGDGVFSNCSSLMSFSGKFSSPDGLFLIDPTGALIAVASGAIDREVIIPDGVTRIGNRAFEGSRNLTSIRIPESVTSIGYSAFSGCESLTSITIPESVTSIWDSAFFRCTGLTSITIPDSVTTIGRQAFSYCTHFSGIIVKPKVPPTGGSGMFDNTNNALLYVPAGSVDAYKSAQYWNDYTNRIQTNPSSSISVPEAVDLGLPSGLKWASFNLGASKPEEYGDYYAWGETEPYYSLLDPFFWKEGKEGYLWSFYMWSRGQFNMLTKYCNNSEYGYNGFTDERTMLDLEDNAAYVNLGGSWRMPTGSEWSELMENCTWTWITQNGVEGQLITATNGNSIFLPAAGYRFDIGLLAVGAIGRYWSSSITTDRPYDAWMVGFDSNEVRRYGYNRYYGLPVRPVYGGQVVPVESVSLNITELELSVGGETPLTATVLPENTANKALSWMSSNEYVATISSDGVVTGRAAGSALITATADDGGKTATCFVIVRDAPSAINIPEAIDLGLSVKWASFNLGASKPEEYGDYYAWGETEPYYSNLDPWVTWKDGKEAGYAWSSYMWCTGQENTLTRYCNNSEFGYNGFMDEKTILIPEDDAAHVHHGGSWRMPTDAEWTELRENCTWSWITQNGVEGQLVTATNGNSIFLPAAGYKHLTGSHSGDGNYWSSSLVTDFTYDAWMVHFTGYDGVFRYGYFRYYGFSVRPVYAE